MKRLVVSVLAGMLLAGTVFGAVVKKTKSEISFQKFGTFSTVQDEKLTAERKSTDKQSSFKGKGIVSSLAGKALLRSGVFGEIIDLPQSTVTTIDHKRKSYQVSPLEPLDMKADKETSSRKPTEEEKPEESNIKIIRSEFKVEKMGESKTINQFACAGYLITWVTDWENTKSGAKGTDRLSTEVWTTPLTADLKTGQQLQAAFFKEYMKQLGSDTDSDANDYLGLSWIQLLGSMDPTGSRPQISMAKAAAEMKKIQGFPVVVDGKYYSKSEGGEEGEEEESGGGLLGKLGKKLLKKKDAKEEGDTPFLAYYTELMEIRTANLTPEDFQPPAGYKKK